MTEEQIFEEFGLEPEPSSARACSPRALTGGYVDDADHIGDRTHFGVAAQTDAPGRKGWFLRGLGAFRLVPRRTAEASARSLSGQHGHGAFPFRTVCRRPVLKTPRPFGLRTAPLVALAALVVLALTPALSRAEIPAGSLDPNFGNAGVSALGGVVGSFNDVATYDSGPEQGKLVAAGVTNDGPVRSILLARFSANGTLDQSFGTSGIVVSSLNLEFASAVAPARDGGVLVVAEGPSPTQSVIARFTKTGDLDDGGGQAGSGFGSCGCGFVGGLPPITGIAVATHGPGAGEILYTARDTVGRLTADGSPLWQRQLAIGASAVAERPDGDLVVTGTASTYPETEISAVELHSDGSIDDGFGTNGVASFDISDRVINPDPTSVAIDSAGRALIGGIVDAPGVCDSFVARLTDAGELDGGFGDRGVQSLPRTFVNEVVVDAQNRVLAGGTVDCRQLFSSDMGAVRLQEADGAPDPTFGTEGTASVTPASDASGDGSGMALTERGIVVAGLLNLPGAGRPALASFLNASEGVIKPKCKKKKHKHSAESAKKKKCKKKHK
jgi:uncharacterized delta-60 repeat protein